MTSPMENMPQDNLRAAVYRSLNKTLRAGCEERSDRVECGTIGRAKTSDSPTGHYRVLDQLAHGCGEGEEEAMAYREESEFQLHKVSMGAHKLTRMIESWPKAPGLDRDLLQGALDLQESLLMLGKLQEASKHMSKKKKQKGQVMEERGRYGEDLSAEARFSVDGSSRKCVEDLKQVIRDSFRRQNLLSFSSDDEKVLRSQSLRFPTRIGFMDTNHEPKERKEACAPVAVEHKKVRAPNLIAKLMGLEEVPSRNFQLIKKEEEQKKSLKSPRPIFDIEMPRLRNFQLVEQNLDPKRKTLDEVIQTMQLKGLLKSDRPQRHSRVSSDALQFEGYRSEFAKDDEAPPIVIMKPLHLPKDLHFDEFPIQEEAYSHKWVQEKKQSVQLVREESVQLVKEKRVLDHGRMMSKKLEKKEVKSLQKPKSESPQEVKPHEVYQKLPAKEAFKTRKKFSAGTKPLLNGGKIEEKKDLKPIKAPVSQAKASTARAKPDKKVSVVTNAVSTHTTAPRNRNQSPPEKPRQKNSSISNVKKTVGAKPGRKATKIVNTDKKCKENVEEIVPPLDEDSISTENSILPVEETPGRAHQDFKHCLKDDDTRKDHELYCDISQKSPQPVEEVIKHADKIPPAKASGLNISHLLLSSQSFLSLVQQLLSPVSPHSLCYQTNVAYELDTKNDKLFLDCSEELITRKIYQRDLKNHPMLQTCIPATTIYVSLDQLIEEVSSEIEKLSSYNKAVEEDGKSEDSLYLRLGKDLRCNDMLTNATWDFGWVTWISMEEADEVVGAVGELILSSIIEEIVMELVD